MGSARRFRRQIDLTEVAAHAERCAVEIREALSRSVMTRPGDLDAEAKRAFDLMKEIDDVAAVLDVLRRRPWQRPNLPWRTIATLKAAEVDREPTKFDRKLARFDSAHRDARRALFAFGTNLHAENIEKVVSGLDHHDPEEREAWETIADKTPFETWSLVQRMRKPPARRGRPKGSGSYKEADEQARPEMNRLIDAGLSPQKAALALAPLLRGGGTPDSKARRLRRRPEKKST